jgi:DNA-binding NarL/FixJ family response regulator
MSGGALVVAIIAHDFPPPLAGEGQGGGDIVAIVADRRLSVAALSALLLRDPRYQLLHEVRGAAAVRDAIDAAQPAIVVVDSTSPDGFPPPLAGEGQGGGHTLLLLDPEAAPEVFLKAVQTRARGFLSRSASRETFALAIATLSETGWYLDPQLTGPVLTAMKASQASSNSARGALSQRQRDILVRIASGHSTKEVAREYAIAPKTVGNHVNHIYRKLNLRDRGQLVLYAAQRGLTNL